ncbi:MAG: hypothetical protein KGQ52_08560 [Alphaproteobacteria bacterium]|nr:hypothetical protein [Alphaproteobacteria bacterium]
MAAATFPAGPAAAGDALRTLSLVPGGARNRKARISLARIRAQQGADQAVVA